jgi:hypothetical protein
MSAALLVAASLFFCNCARDSPSESRAPSCVVLPPLIPPLPPLPLQALLLECILGRNCRSGGAIASIFVSVCSPGPGGGLYPSTWVQWAFRLLAVAAEAVGAIVGKKRNSIFNFHICTMVSNQLQNTYFYSSNLHRSRKAFRVVRRGPTRVTSITYQMARWS